MMPPTKRRKFSDLSVQDTNKLLLKLEEFCSRLDEWDEELPAGLIDKLRELHDKFEDVKYGSFSEADAWTLLSLKISSGPLFLIESKRRELEDLGSTETAGPISMDTTWFLICLVCAHVAAVVRDGDEFPRSIIWFIQKCKVRGWMSHLDQHALLRERCQSCIRATRR
ncbi:hypothetical protein F5I97DRAFT_1916578 [Phlebopus sp. FC_14]|nr:hypothetical protein F5I97DRAFT_1916578 [Phlebopus sp. FC_14]